MRRTTMSTRLSSKTTAAQENLRAIWSGDFAVLKDFLAERDTYFWIPFQLLDSLLRGFGQVTFANNPLSGLLIAAALAGTAPGTLIVSVSTAFLGLLLSVLLRDSQDNIENGLTVCNPLLVGAISFNLIPRVYGTFDAFSTLVVLLATIFSVYLTRSARSSKYPCLVWPFNLVEYTLLITLAVQENDGESVRILRPIIQMDNATSDATTDDVSFIGENATNVYIDWGMLFQGVVVSASQLYAVESVAAGAIVYLAIFIFSPITAGFGFLGALIGSLGGLELGVEIDEIYSGLWGYNSLLVGVSLGGNLLVLNGQSVAATLVAIVYTVIVQYSILFFFKKIELPVLTLPFVIVASLFIKLANGSENGAFVRPTSASFPEKQRQDYLARHRAFAKQIDNAEESDTEARSGDKLVSVVNA